MRSVIKKTVLFVLLAQLILAPLAMGDTQAALADDLYGNSTEYAGPFVMVKSSVSGNAMANKKEIKFSGRVDGGKPPYTIYFEVRKGDRTVYENELRCGKSVSMSYMPTSPGKYRVSVRISDSNSENVYHYATVEVAQEPIYEYPADWEATLKDVKLTGDWRQDVIAVAESQLGYQASDKYFTVDENNVKHRYTRYGEWYGAPYSEWCVMFISFCLHYAGIPASAVPQVGGCVELTEALQKMHVYHLSADYTPAMGDLVLFTRNKEKRPDHAGIVISAENGTLKTIEGNTTDGVAYRQYELTDSQITGYGSMSEMIGNAK